MKHRTVKIRKKPTGTEADFLLAYSKGYRDAEKEVINKAAAYYQDQLEDLEKEVLELRGKLNGVYQTPQEYLIDLDIQHPEIRRVVDGVRYSDYDPKNPIVNPIEEITVDTESITVRVRTTPVLRDGFLNPTKSEAPILLELKGSDTASLRIRVP